MAQYILAKDVQVGNAQQKAGKIIDDGVYNITRYLTSGATLIPIPNAAVEAAAAIVRKQQARGQSDDDINILAAAYAGYGRFSANVGDGVATVIPVVHNLGTLDVVVQVFLNSTGTLQTTGVTIVRTDINTATLTFLAAPATAAMRVTVLG